MTTILTNDEEWAELMLCRDPYALLYRAKEHAIDAHLADVRESGRFLDREQQAHETALAILDCAQRVLANEDQLKSYASGEQTF